MTSDLEVSARYAPLGVKNRPPGPGRFAQLRSALTAPLLGSRLVFPRRFDAAVMRKGSPARDIPPSHAFWYFGATLRFWIDPQQLRWRLADFVVDHRGPRWIGSSFLSNGDWSAALADIEKSPIHREVVELVAADLNFRETEAYRQFLRRARRGRPYTRNGIVLAGPKQVEAYFSYCADLARSMRAGGIVPRRELGRHATGRTGHVIARPWMLDFAERDIGVAIAENGELIRHLGGKHRTAIALALQLPRIPVELRLVHVGWLRGEMRRRGLPAHQALPAAVLSTREESSTPPVEANV